jgi:hypothetical protein
VIHEDPELVADRYRLNTASACLALRIMDSSASAAQQKTTRRVPPVLKSACDNERLG